LNKIKLEILGLSPSQAQAGSFALVLGEIKGERRLPIIIGMFEAQAIAIEIEKMVPNRPMTHDLFKQFAEKLSFDVVEIIITSISEGIFYAKIVCDNGLIREEIDARPSDAIAIGIRFNAPIFILENVLEEAGISTNEADQADIASDELEDELEELISEETSKLTADEVLKKASFDELQKLLKEALKNEDYEKAAKVRDEIGKRN
jgi:uncharacterized protein